METILMLFGGMLHLLGYAFVLAVVYWVFTIARDISEIKEILLSVKRTPGAATLANAVAMPSPSGAQPPAPPLYDDVVRLVDELPRIPEVIQNQRP